LLDHVLLGWPLFAAERTDHRQRRSRTLRPTAGHPDGTSLNASAAASDLVPARGPGGPERGTSVVCILAMASESEPTKQSPAVLSAAVRGRLLRFSMVVPGVLMAASLGGLALYCHAVLTAAADGREPPIGGASFWLAVVAFFAAAAGAIVLQCVRLASRVAGPEYRLRRAMQRIRGHDVGFRVSLRRGDLLSGLARECNDLLDWLNENPPEGVRTGGDVVEIEAEREERADA
jgi:hypothetical protein